MTMHGLQTVYLAEEPSDRRRHNALPGRRIMSALLVVVLCGGARAGDRVDPTTARKSDGMCWYNVAALGVEGRGWDDTEVFYDRLPARAKAGVRPPVWSLSRNLAGMCLRFVTDATAIHTRWALRSRNLAMPHMPATGVSGVDLYVKGSDARWNWLSVGRPQQFPTNTVRLVGGLTDGKREYRLYLPLYNGVTSVELGLPEKASLWQANAYPPKRRKPIVFYGTSITHGACASRPGMAHPAILGRWLDHPVINLGFSGNGTMDLPVAELLAELDPSVYVIDCLPNMNGKQVRERAELFVALLRKQRPDTPILLVEDRTYSNSAFLPSLRSRHAYSRAELRKAYFRMKEKGVKDLHYLPGSHLLGDSIDNEATVDNSHPTDLGFMRQAEAFRQVLQPLLPGAADKDRLAKEWRRTGPDVAVYLPRGVQDEDNEHFLVFEAPKSDELLAMWNQSSVEGRGDNRAVLARSMDGVRWSEPVILAGSGPGRNERQANWPFPVVAKTGRLYCFFTRELEVYDNNRQGSGALGCIWSDDNGYAWKKGPDIPMPRNRFDNPDTSKPRNWIVWQKPIRDSKGRWIVGYTQCTSYAVRKKVSPYWVHTESRCAFMRFDNIDEGPASQDLKITWLPTDREGLEVPDRVFPEISVAQEPSLVLLPDGRLFCVMRTMDGHIWHSVSSDDGATWRAPEMLRYRDDGEGVKQPLAPCPIYALADGRFLLVFHNNDGTLGKASQWKKKWRGNEANFIRHPAYIAVGTFKADAHQPIWFDAPKKLLDTGGVPIGPKGTAEVATYTSLTEWHGKRTLWYPDRKYFLLGKTITDQMLE